MASLRLAQRARMQRIVMIDANATILHVFGISCLNIWKSRFETKRINPLVNMDK